MPILDQRFLSCFRKALSFVRLNVEFTVLTDVREVCADRANCFASSSHLDHDFRCPADCAPNFLDLRLREARWRRRACAPAAEQL